MGLIFHDASDEDEPIFEFVCDNCGHVELDYIWEQPFECPECKKGTCHGPPEIFGL